MPTVTFKNVKNLVQGKFPGQVVLQYTDRCNASCAQCGMRRENRYPRTTLTPEVIKPMIDKMAEQGIEALSFTGGEPLLYLHELDECIRYARKAGIRYVRTGTNGFMFKGHEKPDFADKVKKMASTLVEAGVYNFWISLDSASAEIHEKNRGLADTVAGMEKALPIMHECGLYPAANLGINRYLGGHPPPPSSEFDPDTFYTHFRDGFRNFYQTVHSLGFTTVNACYPMDFDSNESDAVYTATSDGDFVQFSHEEKAILFRALFDTIPEFRHQLRIFTPLTALRSLIRHYEGQTDDSYACRGGIEFFFVDAQNMDTYPCGFRGDENFGKFHEIDFDKIDPKAWCKQCDWECFRDPSELFGPLMDMVRRPWHIGKRMWQDREYAKLWLSDMRYYNACGYFNAGLAPNKKALARFKLRTDKNDSGNNYDMPSKLKATA